MLTYRLLRLMFLQRDSGCVCMFSLSLRVFVVISVLRPDHSKFLMASIFHKKGTQKCKEPIVIGHVLRADVSKK